jgi:peroxiredoxin
LVQLAQWRERFADLGVNLAAMTYDSREILKSFHDSQSLGYPLLQDVDAAHIKAFGVLNEEYVPGDRGYGIPHPGILFIRPDGVVALKFAVPGYRGRPPLEQVYEAIQALETEAAD